MLICNTVELNSFQKNPNLPNSFHRHKPCRCPHVTPRLRTASVLASMSTFWRGTKAMGAKHKTQVQSLVDCSPSNVNNICCIYNWIIHIMIYHVFMYVQYVCTYYTRYIQATSTLALQSQRFLAHDLLLVAGAPFAAGSRRISFQTYDCMTYVSKFKMCHIVHCHVWGLRFQLGTQEMLSWKRRGPWPKHAKTIHQFYIVTYCCCS